jgi:hypothetical protein
MLRPSHPPWFYHLPASETFIAYILIYESSWRNWEKLTNLLYGYSTQLRDLHNFNQSRYRWVNSLLKSFNVANYAGYYITCSISTYGKFLEYCSITYDNGVVDVSRFLQALVYWDKNRCVGELTRGNASTTSRFFDVQWNQPAQVTLLFNNRPDDSMLASYYSQQRSIISSLLPHRLLSSLLTSPPPPQQVYQGSQTPCAHLSCDAYGLVIPNSSQLKNLWK